MVEVELIGGSRDGTVLPYYNDDPPPAFRVAILDPTHAALSDSAVVLPGGAKVLEYVRVQSKRFKNYDGQWVERVIYECTKLP